MAIARMGAIQDIPTELRLVILEKDLEHPFAKNDVFVEQVINDIYHAHQMFCARYPVVYGFLPVAVVSPEFFDYLNALAKVNVNKRAILNRDTFTDQIIIPIRFTRAGSSIQISGATTFKDFVCNFGVDQSLEDWQARVCFDDGKDPELTIGISDNRLFA
jgi:hypothetical protein